jgi:hypothetical protein
MSFKTFLLCLIILILGTFIYLKASSLGDENSYFNQNTRYKLGKYGIMRVILSLHKDGDARAEYLLGSSPIVVEVVEAEGIDMDNGVLEEFGKKVQEYTGRPVKLYNVDTMKSGVLTDEDLPGVVSSFRRHKTIGGAGLFIIYAQDFEGNENEIGRTYKEYGILLSHNKISTLTNHYSSARKQYVISTLLHEFGHQIGLDHNPGPDCVMNEAVESPSRTSSFSGSFTPISFCGLEQDLLEGIKTNLR